MPCGICHENGHNATRCQNPVILENTSLVATEIMNRINNKVISQMSNLAPGVIIRNTRGGNIYHHANQNMNIEAIRETIITSRCQFLDAGVMLPYEMTLLTKRWSLPLFRQATPLLLSRLETILTTDHNLPDLITDFKRLDADDIYNAKTYYRRHFLKCSNFILRALVPDSFLNLSNMTVDQLCRPLPPPVLSNDEVIANALDNLLETRDTTSFLVILKEIRQLEVQRARLASRAAENRAVARAVNRARRSFENQVKPRIKFQMDSMASDYMSIETCACCLEDLSTVNTVALACKHAFCSACTGEFINKCNGTCPSCRESITEVRFKPNILPENFNSLVSSISHS
jgi:hypothetical protein